MSMVGSTRRLRTLPRSPRAGARAVGDPFRSREALQSRGRPLPAVCGGCEARVVLVPPPIALGHCLRWYWADVETGKPHQCRSERSA